MTYEEYLDEVTTLITEKYDLSDEAAIAMVMRARRMIFSAGTTTTRRSARWNGRTRMQGSYSKITRKFSVDVSLCSVKFSAWGPRIGWCLV